MTGTFSAHGLAVPVSIFGVVKHEQISLSAQARAASASDTTIVHALHHVFDAATLFSIAPLVFIVYFVRWATVRPPSTTRRSGDHYLRNRRRIVLNRTDRRQSSFGAADLGGSLWPNEERA